MTMSELSESTQQRLQMIEQCVLDAVALTGDVTAELSKMTEASRKVASDKCMVALARIKEAQGVLEREATSSESGIAVEGNDYLEQQALVAAREHLDAIRFQVESMANMASIPVPGDIEAGEDGEQGS